MITGGGPAGRSLALAAAHFRFRRQNHAHDQTEQADGGRENLDDQNLDEERRIRRIRKRRSGADHADRDAAEEIGHAHGQTGAEDHVAGEPIVALIRQLVQFLLLIRFDGAEQNDRHDDAVDCDRLAEDDRHQVLGLDSRRLHTAADDRDTGGEDAERRTDDAQRDRQAGAQGTVHVRRDACVGEKRGVRWEEWVASDRIEIQLDQVEIGCAHN